MSAPAVLAFVEGKESIQKIGYFQPGGSIYCIGAIFII